MSRELHLPAAATPAAAGLLVLLLGCEASTPPTPAPRQSPAATPSPAATSSPAPSATPDFSSLTDLGSSLSIGTLGPEHTEDMLAFASTADAIIYSSGVAPDVASDTGAPDLWRVELGTEPERLWRNPARDHTLVVLAGDLGTYAFVDMPTTGEREWTLHVRPRDGDATVVLDEHPGDEDVPSFVPSLAVYEERVVWSAFDRGPDGAVSQLLTAAAPDWEPQLLVEHPAAETEIWLPSLLGTDVVYTEVHYSADRESDERSVWFMPIDRPEKRRRLDTTGRATMPVIVPDAVFWKQADRGYNMFNWGRMYRYDPVTQKVAIVDTAPQTYVNYPSGGDRFLAWRGADSFQFGVYDHILDETRLIEVNPPESDATVVDVHLHEQLLAWMRVVGDDENAVAELRYAYLPGAAETRASSR